MPAGLTHRCKHRRSASLCCPLPKVTASGGRRVALARAEAKKPVVILPGLGNSSADYSELSELLQSKYSCDVEVAPVNRADWARNAAGLADVRYWQGTLPPRPTVDWYLNSISKAISELEVRGHSRPLGMLTHSAGGWLGRVFMNAFGSDGIDRFVSLGSPHMPPPKDVPGAIDQTRGILQYCDDTFPGCHEEGVKYVTVAGKFLEGIKWGEEGSLQQRIVGQGYKQVCGEADVWGDGIVPVPAAHLPGATQLERACPALCCVCMCKPVVKRDISMALSVEGVYHSPLGATQGRTWYGDEEHIEKWVGHLIEP